jgi:cobalamin synthase
MVRGFIGAVRVLSIIPIPGREADNRAAALTWFPAVGARTRDGVLGWVLAAALLAGLGPRDLAAPALGFAAAKALGHVYLRAAGGVTGDLLGAASEVVETALLALAALLGTRLEAVSGWAWGLR